MQVWKVDNSLRASLITGPTHNLLGLELRDNDGIERPIDVVDLRPADETIATVHADEVMCWVMQALEEYSTPENPQPIVTRIEFRRDDTHLQPAYKRLVHVILTHYWQTLRD